MIAAISRSLCSSLNSRISVIEAGTGVGKSVGYLIPAINVALAQDKKIDHFYGNGGASGSIGKSRSSQYKKGSG